jgi:hypothetical protein
VGPVVKAGAVVVVAQEGFLYGSVGVIKAIEGTLGRLHIKVSGLPVVRVVAARMLRQNLLLISSYQWLRGSARLESHQTDLIFVLIADALFTMSVIGQGQRKDCDRWVPLSHCRPVDVS